MNTVKQRNCTHFDQPRRIPTSFLSNEYWVTWRLVSKMAITTTMPNVLCLAVAGATSTQDVAGNAERGLWSTPVQAYGSASPYQFTQAPATSGVPMASVVAWDDGVACGDSFGNVYWGSAAGGAVGNMSSQPLTLQAEQGSTVFLCKDMAGTRLYAVVQSVGQITVNSNYTTDLAALFVSSTAQPNSWTMLNQAADFYDPRHDTFGHYAYPQTLTAGGGPGWVAANGEFIAIGWTKVVYSTNGGMRWWRADLDDARTGDFPDGWRTHLHDDARGGGIFSLDNGVPNPQLFVCSDGGLASCTADAASVMAGQVWESRYNRRLYNLLVSGIFNGGSMSVMNMSWWNTVPVQSGEGTAGGQGPPGLEQTGYGSRPLEPPLSGTLVDVHVLSAGFQDNWAALRVWLPGSEANGFWYNAGDDPGGADSGDGGYTAVVPGVQAAIWSAGYSAHWTDLSGGPFDTMANDMNVVPILGRLRAFCSFIGDPPVEPVAEPRLQWFVDLPQPLVAVTVGSFSNTAPSGLAGETAILGIFPVTASQWTSPALGGDPNSVGRFCAIPIGVIDSSSKTTAVFSRDGRTVYVGQMDGQIFTFTSGAHLADRPVAGVPDTQQTGAQHVYRFAATADADHTMFAACATEYGGDFGAGWLLRRYGATWTAIQSYSDTAVQSICADDIGWLFVALRDSVHAYDSTTGTWYVAGEGLPSNPRCQEIRCVVSHEPGSRATPPPPGYGLPRRYLYLGTWGRSVWMASY